MLMYETESPGSRQVLQVDYYEHGNEQGLKFSRWWRLKGEDEGSTVLRNVGTLPYHYKVS